MVVGLAFSFVECILSWRIDAYGLNLLSTSVVFALASILLLATALKDRKKKSTVLTAE